MASKLARLLAGILLLLILSAQVGVLRSSAQIMDRSWTDPYRLSTTKGNVTGAGVLATDNYGYVHSFWGESNPITFQILIQYARYDGKAWTTPRDIFVTKPFATISKLGQPVIDKDNNLHLVWTGGNEGPIYYMRAPAHEALSVQNWTEPVVIFERAKFAQIRADSNGVLHIVYMDSTFGQSGIYYIRSENDGLTWSVPRSLDPSVPSEFYPSQVLFIIDEKTGGLHALWKFMEGQDLESLIGRDVRYAHSLDGGDTWSAPYIVDEAEEGDDELKIDATLLAARDNIVHIIWAGNSEGNRENRISYDGGTSWSPTRRVFGGLNGGAGDSLIFDDQGRLHFFGQIRFPMALYEIIWQDNIWQAPSIVYLIREDSDTSLKADENESTNVIHVHGAEAAIRNKNEIFVSFTNPPAEEHRFLFVIHKTMDDITPESNGPTPVPTFEPTPTPNIGIPIAIPRTPSFVTGDDLLTEDLPSPVNSLWLGVIPVALVLLGIVATWIYIRR